MLSGKMLRKILRLVTVIWDWAVELPELLLTALNMKINKSNVLLLQMCNGMRFEPRFTVIPFSVHRRRKVYIEYKFVAFFRFVRSKSSFSLFFAGPMPIPGACLRISVCVLRWSGIWSSVGLICAQHVQWLSLGGDVFKSGSEFRRCVELGLFSLLIVEQMLFECEVEVDAESVCDFLAQVYAVYIFNFNTQKKTIKNTVTNLLTSFS